MQPNDWIMAPLPCSRRTPLRQNVLNVIRLTSLVALLGATSLVSAQSFPDKPIHLISPSPPGGGTDTATRLLATKITELTKWQFVVDTRPGAGGNIGLAIGGKSAADGYTLVMGETSNLTVNQESGATVDCFELR